MAPDHPRSPPRSDAVSAGTQHPATQHPAPPLPLLPGAVNWRGMWTLYVKEVRRFLKVGSQTVIAPPATALLFLAVFSLALGGAVRTVHDVPFVEFLAPGLIMMSIIQNAFANTSSSLMISKIQGNIVDMLMPPLAAWEMTLAFALGGLTRGILVGLSVAVALRVFVPMGVHDFGMLLFHACAASLMLSLLGVIAGLWADKFDQLSAFTNFAITPLSFLSGTFYSISRLPEPWLTVAHFNPFFYMIDGFRYGIIGRADSDPFAGVVVLVLCNAALAVACVRLLHTGYKIKT